MLTNTALRLAKPGDKPRKLVDGNGLYVLLQPTGSKLWRFDFRFDGKRKSLALGAYPDVSLKDARARLAVAREQLAAGIDPVEAKKERKRADKIAAANSFEAVTRAWWEKWRADRTEGTAHAAIPVWRRVAAGILPTGVKIGPNSTRWNVGAIRRYLANLGEVAE